MKQALDIRAALESSVTPLEQHARDRALGRIQDALARPGALTPRRLHIRVPRTVAVSAAVAVSAVIVAAAVAVMAHVWRQPGARAPSAPGRERVVPPPVHALRPGGPPASTLPSSVPAPPSRVVPAAPPPPPARPATRHPRRELTAEALYLQAEAALRGGHFARAGALLRRVVQRDRDTPLADAARYDLALLAIRLGRARQALELLDRIAADADDGPLGRAARALRCHVARENRLPCGARAP